MTPIVCDKLFRRDFLLSCELSFPAIYHEDEVFVPLLMAQSPRTAMLRRPLYYYVKREGSISGLRVTQKASMSYRRSRS